MIITSYFGHCSFILWSPKHGVMYGYTSFSVPPPFPPPPFSPSSDISLTYVPLSNVETISAIAHLSYLYGQQQ